MSILERALRKAAASEAGVSKNKEMIEDFVRPHAVPGINVLNALTAPIGSVAGMIATADKSDKQWLDNPTAASLFPLVGPYRNSLRRQLMDEKLSGGKVKKSRLWSELLGGLTSHLTAGALAALTAGAVSKLKGGSDYEAGKAAAIASGIGSGVSALGSVGGYLLGLGKQTRSTKAHEEYLKDPNANLKNYIIPGVAAYNAAQRSKAELMGLI